MNRADVVADVRRLVDLLEHSSALPVPVTITVTAGTDDDQAACERLDRIEAMLAALGIEHHTDSSDFSRGIEIPIGGVTYRVSHVWSEAMEKSLARHSYAAVVQVDDEPHGEHASASRRRRHEA